MLKEFCPEIITTLAQGAEEIKVSYAKCLLVSFFLERNQFSGSGPKRGYTLQRLVATSTKKYSSTYQPQIFFSAQLRWRRWQDLVNVSSCGFPLQCTSYGWCPSTGQDGGAGRQCGVFRIRLFKLEETLTYLGQPPPFSRPRDGPESHSKLWRSQT